MLRNCRNKIGDLLLRIYEKIVGKKPCAIYKRKPTPYDKKAQKPNHDGFASNCPMCNGNYELIEEYKNFLVIKNGYPYPKTKEHLMIIPKRHVIGIYDFTQEEKLEWADIFSKYLNQGYLIFNREFPKHPDSTLEHFHTQVIKENYY
ncbi:HIT family protein [Candidatus Absconditicoccus praedator]|uniref:HIT family protein n=1 Tax=Candidatus Absconditicoccus praedator TaxID=2735562 RepID=UPI001E4E484F|nr:hypothetical protein [Candidatus Absconditicoccus praedator]UFX82904.1 hypothetical protein HLG78_02100 [Candidatus Absconditicoccus praedator]